MIPETSRNLFRYPLWLTPETYFIVCRNETVYATILPLWLTAHGALPQSIRTHGIMPSNQQMAVTLLCEAPPDYVGHWERAFLGSVIGYSSLSDFPATDNDLIWDLNAFIATQPHRRYVETGKLGDVFDAETLALMIAKERAYDVRQ